MWFLQRSVLCVWFKEQPSLVSGLIHSERSFGYPPHIQQSDSGSCSVGFVNLFLLTNHGLQTADTHPHQGFAITCKLRKRRVGPSWCLRKPPSHKEVEMWTEMAVMENKKQEGSSCVLG